jgi:hypothetical protein
MDNGSLTFGGLVMGGRSLGGRQDQFFGGKHHGGALVILSREALGGVLALSPAKNNSIESYIDWLSTHCSFMLGRYAQNKGQV